MLVHICHPIKNLLIEQGVIYKKTADWHDRMTIL